MRLTLARQALLHVPRDGLGQLLDPTHSRRSAHPGALNHTPSLLATKLTHDKARTLTRLDHLSRSIWQALAAGAVGDDDAQALAERLHARRSLMRGDLKPVGIPPGRPSIFPPRRLQRAPKRPVAIARRLHLAASGPMPPALACKFTVGELAVLRIVGDEVRQHGQCDRCVDEIAARAGVCRRWSRTRSARPRGLVW